MANVCNFKFQFEGQAIDDGQVDLDKHLKPSLIAFKDALFLFHQDVLHQRSIVSLKVKALNDGCFDIDIRQKKGLLARIASFVRGDTNSFHYERSLVRGLLNLIRLHFWLHGENPEKIDIADDRSCVTYYLDNKSYTTDFLTYQGFRSFPLYKLLGQFFMPLRYKGINKVSLTLGDECIVVEKKFRESHD